MCGKRPKEKTNSRLSTGKTAKSLRWMTHLRYIDDCNGDAILARLEEKKLTDFVYGMYERYHTEALENAFEDMDRLLQEK